MIVLMILGATLWGMSFLRVAAAKQSDALTSPTSANCSADSTPCGPTPACCAPSLQCNFRRGIPICQNPAEHYISGFDHYPCADPYLFRCDAELGIPGFCCPIGTSCFNEGNNDIIQCINALGVTASAFPSATTGLVPSATPIPSSDTDIVYSPSSAWNISDADINCTVSKSLHITDTINATILFNYTGPSIMVHAVTSWSGGVFSVVVDGFNTTSEVDTYSGFAANDPLPTCFPVQFPPFVVTPPNYQFRASHTIALVYIGRSPHAPGVTNASFAQFDSFALPDLQDSTSSSSADLAQFSVDLLSLIIIFSLYVIF